MRKTLVESILFEAADTTHALERFKDRFLSSNVFDVGYEIGVGNYKTVGTYVIPPDVIKNISETVDLIKNYNFPKKKDLGIKIFEIRIDPKKVNFTNGSIDEVKQKPLVFVNIAGSNGDVVFVIIRKNVFETIYYGKSYVQQNKEKMRVDFTVSNLKQSIANNKIS